MMSYCLKCKNNTENLDLKELKTKNGRRTLSSKCVVCGWRKSRFMKKEGLNGLLSSLDITTSLSKIPLLGKMFQLHQFLSELHLKQP